MSRLYSGLLCAAAASALIGCGGGEKGNGPNPSISVTVSPPSLTLQQGASGTVSVTLARAGGFSGAVNVSVDGLPSGVTLSVSPSQLTGATTSATVSVTVGAAVAAGTYTATVHASATGVGEATVTYQLTVTATPNYALAATPAAVTIPQGTSGTTTIGVQRTNFTGPVALSLDSPPAGITGTFNPTPATGDQSVLTISVPAGTPTGNYNLTVKGSATGPGDKTTVVTLTVSQQPDYTLSATPNAVTIDAGGSGQTTVNIARTNYSGAVTLALDGAPAGITATFNPSAPTGNSSVATINVAGTVPAGDYSLTIKGTATGVPTSIKPGAEDAAAAAAAGDRTTTVAVTVAPAPDFTISAAPNALQVAPGGSANSNVSVVRTNLTSDIALTLVNPPANITGTFTPATLSGATLTSSLAISVGAGVAPGNYQVTVQGAAGTLTRTASIAVTVVAGPSVSLVASPAALTIEQGASGQSTLTATRTNYTGDITPSVSGNPAGMNVTFNPNPLTGNTSQVTVTVGASVPVGQYNLTVTGDAGAAGNPTTPLQVSVTAPPAGNMVWEYCNIDDVPVKFWRLNNGAWAEVAPQVVGAVTRFAFSITSQQGGVAMTYENTANTGMRRSATGRNAIRARLDRALQEARVARNSAKPSRFRTMQNGAAMTSVFLAMTSELGSFADACETGVSDVAKRFNGLNLQGGEEALLGYGNANTALVAQTDAMVNPGTYDWLALFGPSPAPGPLGEHAWTNYRLGRAEAAPGAAVNVDRAGAPAILAVPFTTSGGLPGSQWTFSQSFISSRGTMGTFVLGQFPNTSGTGSLFFLQPQDRVGTDLIRFSTSMIQMNANDVDARVTERYLSATPSEANDYPINQGVPVFSVTPVSGAPVPTYSSTGAIPSDYQGSQSMVVASWSGIPENGSAYSVTATRSWLTANGMGTTYTLQGQNLPGFLAAWSPGSPVGDVSVTMFGTNYLTVPVGGSVFKFAGLTQSPN